MISIAFKETIKVRLSSVINNHFSKFVFLFYLYNTLPIGVHLKNFKQEFTIAYNRPVQQGEASSVSRCGTISTTALSSGSKSSDDGYIVFSLFIIFLLISAVHTNLLRHFRANNYKIQFFFSCYTGVFNIVPLVLNYKL